MRDELFRQGRPDKNTHSRIHDRMALCTLRHLEGQFQEVTGPNRASSHTMAYFSSVRSPLHRLTSGSALLRHRRHRSTAQPSVRVGPEPRGPWPRCHSCRRRVSPIGAATSAGSAEARRDGAERVCGTWRGQTRMEFGAENERKKQEGTGVNGVCWGDLFLAWVSRFRHGCRKEP